MLHFNKVTIGQPETLLHKVRPDCQLQHSISPPIQTKSSIPTRRPPPPPPKKKKRSNSKIKVANFSY